MRKLLKLAGVAGAAVAVKRLLARRSPPDFTEPETREPQRKVEDIEREVDVPGGVRP